MIKFLGHASIYIKTDTTSLVTDPWFSKTGAFLYNWHQFPDNSEIDMGWKDDLDFVCISHEHQDHFDPSWLRALNDKVKIVIPKYRNRRFYNLLSEAVDNEIIEVVTKNTIDLKGIEYTPIISSPGWDDACLIFKTNDEVIVNANDMNLSTDDKKWINDNFEDIDYLFFQVAGASWHPHTYHYSNEKQRKIRLSKRKSYLKKAENMITALNADVSIPCAGPPCFLDEEFFHLNFIEDSIFMTGDFIYKKLTSNTDHEILLVTPGDKISKENCKLISKTNLKKEFFSNKKKYLEDYKNRRVKLIRQSIKNISEPVKNSLLTDCKKYFEPLIASNKFFRENSKGKLLINVIGCIEEKILINFSKAGNSVSRYKNEKHWYTFDIDAKYLNLIFEKKLFWEDLFLSFRFRAFREPDEFDQLLINFLKFADNDCFRYLERHYKLMERDEKLKETFVKEVNGQTLKIQRYCPHALGDLSNGRIEDDKLYCPHHDWCFSLKNGEGIGNKLSIKINN
tara:strand:- start:946 stop:2472 length:1527 start_codon:yes stop_codon:yes gene_type:complete